MNLPVELVEKAVENLTTNAPDVDLLVVLCLIFARLIALVIRTRNNGK